MGGKHDHHLEHLHLSSLCAYTHFRNYFLDPLANCKQAPGTGVSPLSSPDSSPEAVAQFQPNERQIDAKDSIYPINVLFLFRTIPLSHFTCCFVYWRGGGVEVFQEPSDSSKSLASRVSGEGSVNWMLEISTETSPDTV